MASRVPGCPWTGVTGGRGAFGSARAHQGVLPWDRCRQAVRSGTDEPAVAIIVQRLELPGSIAKQEGDEDAGRRTAHVRQVGDAPRRQADRSSRSRARLQEIQRPITRTAGSTVMNRNTSTRTWLWETR